MMMDRNKFDPKECYMSNDKKQLSANEVYMINELLQKCDLMDDNTNCFVQVDRKKASELGNEEKHITIRMDNKASGPFYFDDQDEAGNKWSVNKLSTTKVFSLVGMKKHDEHNEKIINEPANIWDECAEFKIEKNKPATLPAKIHCKNSQKSKFPITGSKKVVEEKGSFLSMPLVVKDAPSFCTYPSEHNLNKKASTTKAKEVNAPAMVENNDGDKVKASSKKVDPVIHEDYKFASPRSSLIEQETNLQHYSSFIHIMQPDYPPKYHHAFSTPTENNKTKSVVKKSNLSSKPSTLSLYYSAEYDEHIHKNDDYHLLPRKCDPHMGLMGFLPDIGKHVRESLGEGWFKNTGSFNKGMLKVDTLQSKEMAMGVVTGGLDLNFPKDYMISGSIYRFDLLKNSWGVYGVMPEPRYQHASVYLNGKLYIIGGYCPFLRIRGETLAVPTTYCLDLRTNEWMRNNDLNNCRACHAVAVLKGKIHVFGGRDNFGKILNTMEVFSPEKGTWALWNCMPQPIMGCGIAHNRKQAWLIGGITSNLPDIMPSFLDTVYCYNSDTEKWTIETYMMKPKAFCSAALWKDEIWVLGGFIWRNSKTKSLDSVEVYNPSSKLWDGGFHLDNPKHAIGVCKVGEKLLAVGGIESQNLKPSNQVHIIDSFSLSSIAPFPNAIAGCSVVEIPRYA